VASTFLSKLNHWRDVFGHQRLFLTTKRAAIRRQTEDTEPLPSGTLRCSNDHPKRWSGGSHRHLRLSREKLSEPGDRALSAVRNCERSTILTPRPARDT